jgi:tetratricopeptide (TPR) repeat protein
VLVKRFSFLLGLAALLSACIGHLPPLPSRNSLAHLPSSVVIDSIPFHAQDAYQCGPAALAMMLNHRGLPATPASLKDRVYVPKRRGSLQVEMVSAARERDLLVYPVARKLEALIAELDAGNPVLVLQNLAFNWYPRWHYAVVIGYDLASEEMIVHSGVNAAQREPFKMFLHTWRRGDYWARVLLPPNTLPATAEPLAYLRAASDLEETGRLASAQLAYTTALQTWPEQPAARFGLGNIAWAQSRKTEAIQHFRTLTHDFPKFAPAWNNLRVGLEELGCTQAAQVASVCASKASAMTASEFNKTEQSDCRIPACP